MFTKLPWNTIISIPSGLQNTWLGLYRPAGLTGRFDIYFRSTGERLPESGYNKWGTSSPQPDQNGNCIISFGKRQNHDWYDVLCTIANKWYICQI